MFILPGDDKNEAHAGADGGVGDIEGGKANFAATPLLHIKIEEVHHGMAAGKETVSEISRNAAKNQSEGDLAGKAVRIEMVPGQEERHEGHKRDKGEDPIVASKQTPGRAGITPVDEPKEAGNDDLFVAGIQCPQDQPLGELVEREHNQCEHGNPAV